MQAIAYITNDGPRLVWPAVTESDVLDADGNPTGETVTTDNLQSLIAALPQGTQHTLVDEADADAWWKANQSADELATAARDKRAVLLAESDWTQLPDSPLSGDARTAWATYRQALRDITDQQGFPGNIDWPVPPA
jgi:hypothetical protein